jgi:hypothetical protein
MKHRVRLEFEVSWVPRASKLLGDPMGRQIKHLGRELPYRVYLVPNNELLSDRMFNLYDPYWIQETHHLELDPGQWTIAVEDVTGWLDLEIKNVKLNSVHIPTPVFTLD